MTFRTLGGVAVAVTLACLVGGCGSAGSAPHASTPLRTELPATTTLARQPDDGRLHRPYTSDEYQPGGSAMGSWRMDPAPATVVPRMSTAQALAAFQRSAEAKMTAGPGTTTTLRFGLFSGNGPNPTLPDHRLTGSHAIGPLPAWVVLIDGVEMMPSGRGGPPGSPVVTQVPVKGYALAVISDADGQGLVGLELVGGSAAGTGLQ